MDGDGSYRVFGQVGLRAGLELESDRAAVESAVASKAIMGSELVCLLLGPCGGRIDSGLPVEKDWSFRLCSWICDGEEGYPHEKK